MIVRAADLVAKPWPNGRGMTRDIVDQDRSADGLGWLLSLADLSGDAAFSHFPHCDRVFTLIDGEGVTLDIEGRTLACRPLVPSCFSGDRGTQMRMKPLPARAFNLFFDRRRFGGGVASQMIADDHSLASPHDTVAIFCAFGKIAVPDGILGVGDTSLASGVIDLRAVDGAACALMVSRAAR